MSSQERLETIEVLLSHLQHDIDKLNEALIAQQAEIAEMKRSFSRLQAAVEDLPQVPTNPLDERPPHY